MATFIQPTEIEGRSTLQQRGNGSLKMLFLIFFGMASLAAAVAPLDTLKQGQMLNSSTTLVSQNKIFTMGFFRREDVLFTEDPEFGYLGIWYTKEFPRGHPVWIANRKTPIYYNSGVLTISATGKLMITDKRGHPIELYSGLSSSSSTGTLLDTGNFVLNSGGNANKVLWQSFDFPTDTLLPGMKLGVNHKTGQSWKLTSWFGPYSPDNGNFTLEWDPIERRLIVKRGGLPYWTSGKNFEFVPKVDGHGFNYNFTNVTSEDEEYFSYAPEHGTTKSRWRLDFMGNIADNDRVDYMFNMADNEWFKIADNDGFKIAAVDLCYGYNTGGSGCQSWKQPKCRHSNQKFEDQTGFFSQNDEFYANGKSVELSFSDCRAECWGDCDCLGFALSFDTHCTLWSGKNIAFTYGAHKNYYEDKYLLITNASMSPAPPNKKGKNLILIITAVVVPLVMMLLSSLFYYLWRKFKQVRTGEEEELQELWTMNGDSGTTELVHDVIKGHDDLKVFSFACIAAATTNFLLTNKLGEGGFGPVYKGELPNGQEVAIKRLSRKSGQGLLEFKNELNLIAKLQHTNLVRLLGYCIHGDEKMLIYEYMPNKSLDFFLFDETKRMQLTWERRLSIIEGIAQGLLYLHKYSRLRIVHRDLKAGNILLDQNMNPKISDFGMARIFKQNLSEANTKRVVGTFGYMAPEYAMEGIFSVKSDVYSFGVLMLEILSGRKSNSFYNVEGPLNIVAFAWELWNRDAALELMDRTLEYSCIAHQFLRCAHVSLLCVEDRALNRPTMSGVISMLTNETADLPMPIKPAFYTGRSGGLVEEDSEKGKSQKNISVNGLSISEMEAR